MIRRLMTVAAVAAIAMLAGCSTFTKDSSFEKATTENTARANTYQDNILLQAGHDLTAIHQCYLRASGYVLVDGTTNLLQKIAEPASAEGCTVMAMGLRTQSNMLTAFAPFMAQSLMSRVPASPEEIFQALAEKGMNFALMRFGIEQVSAVVNNGQAAAYQVASQAMAKNPIILNPGVINNSPAGASMLMSPSATTVNP